MPPFFEPRHMPCEECGASVASDERDGHVCDAERRLEYVLFQLRDEISSFDGQLAAYLRSRSAIHASKRPRGELR